MPEQPNDRPKANDLPKVQRSVLAVLGERSGLQSKVLLPDSDSGHGNSPVVDPGASAAIMDLISRLNRDHGLTVILVSHHLRLVRSLVHSVIWVEGGKAAKGPTKVMLAPERVSDIFGTLTGTE